MKRKLAIASILIVPIILCALIKKFGFEKQILIDPASGSYRYETGLEFTRNFETEARWLVDKKLDDIEFRDQIIFWEP